MKCLCRSWFTNSQGQAVGTLKKDDFQIFDDGKPQVLTGFTLVTRSIETATSVSSASAPSSAPASPQPPTPVPRFVVFLFDDLNLSSSDLARAQTAATQLLDTALPASDTAAVLSTSGTNSGLTRDRAKLKAAIQNLRASSLYRHDANDCPNVDYYQGDLILNKNDSLALQAATEDALTCSNLDPSQASVAARMAQQAARRAVALGEQDYRSTLSFLRLIVSKLGALPGQRVLILISPGFLTSDVEAMTLKSQVLDVAAQSNVTISAIDARGLYTTNVEASNQGGGSMIDVRAQPQYLEAARTASESVMAELADGTGGTYFHKQQ